jgi:hypothetical protein
MRAIRIIYNLIVFALCPIWLTLLFYYNVVMSLVDGQEEACDLFAGRKRFPWKEFLYEKSP